MSASGVTGSSLVGISVAGGVSVGEIVGAGVTLLHATRSTIDKNEETLRNFIPSPWWSVSGIIGVRKNKNTPPKGGIFILKQAGLFVELTSTVPHTRN